LLRIEDWAYLVDLARTQQIAWQLQAAIFPQQKLRKALIHELRHLAWASDYLKIENNGISIVTNREKEKISAQDALQLSTLGVRIDVSSSANELEPMIRTKVVIAEVRRSVTQKLGIKWPESFQIGGESSVINISSVTALLEAIETTGEGRILAMPNLLCRSGGEAKFFAGGEIPIRTSNYRTTSVEWKKYGITLHVQPRADRMKRLKFQLRTEISSIDDSNKSSQDIPGITSNSIETQFNLAGAQTIALSGLIKREEGRHLSNLGILNSIPILGKLFESQDFRKMVTELIIFLTPEISFPGFAEGAER
jgi:pilus assembly protein CpaC